MTILAGSVADITLLTCSKRVVLPGEGGRKGAGNFLIGENDFASTNFRNQRRKRAQ